MFLCSLSFFSFNENGLKIYSVTHDSIDDPVLQCVMSKDWRNALKLCNYILMYEKDHLMANQYSPILRRAVMELEEGSMVR